MTESKESPTGTPLAITGFICGLTGCALGMVPLLATQAMVLGAAGLAFGLTSKKRAPGRDIQSRLALSAIILGCLAVGLATIEFVIADSLLRHLSRQGYAALGGSLLVAAAIGYIFYR